MKKTLTTLLVGTLLLVLASGCETLNNMDKAIGRGQVKIEQFFARLFLAEKESVNFAVRIRHEFFVYLPPFDEAQAGIDELSQRIMANVSGSQIEVLMDQSLEKEASRQGTDELRYLDNGKYRIFVEPRFISFIYCDGTPPAVAELDKGRYALNLQTQIIIRDKRNGAEVWRHTIDVKGAHDPHELMRFGDKSVFDKDVETLTLTAAGEILRMLKDRKPIVASQERYASLYSLD
jgi:hypothetical protein